MTGRSLPSLVISSALFFASGALGLGHQLVWIRKGALVAGASQIALSTVLTSLHLAPTQLVRMLELDEQPRAAFDGSSLEVAWHGAAPRPKRVKDQMIEWWGPILTEYYGGTEGAIVTVISSEEWLERPDSVGRPVSMAEGRVLDEDGKPCRGAAHLRADSLACIGRSRAPARAAHPSLRVSTSRSWEVRGPLLPPVSRSCDQGGNDGDRSHEPSIVGMALKTYNDLLYL